MKQITVPINSLRHYIELFNGLFGLTDSEIEVLTEFLRVKLSLEKAERDDNPFSTEMKKRVADLLDRDDFNSLNTYIMRIKNKGAIKPTENGYEINRILVPDGSSNEVKIKLK